MNATQDLESAVERPSLRTSLDVPLDDLAPRTARAFTRATLEAWELCDLRDRALLIVSELATNARRHGRTLPESQPEDMRLTLAFHDGVLGIELEDNSSVPPIPRSAPTDVLNGRGLHLVAAEADAWMSRPKPCGAGKSVLAFIRSPDTAPSA